jgi:hypothetical protein
MGDRSVVLVAFKEFDNLGVGYLASVLSEAGYEPLIVDFRNGKEGLLDIINKLNPLIVGFSVIFQYHINEFRDVIKYLRRSGITSHFSAGGQYAGMRYEDLFKIIPTLDSTSGLKVNILFWSLLTKSFRNRLATNQGLAYKRKAKF